MPRVDEFCVVCDRCKKPFVNKRRNDRGELVDLENLYNTFDSSDTSKLYGVCQVCYALAGAGGPPIELRADGKNVHVRRVERAALPALLDQPEPKFDLGYMYNMCVGDHVLLIAPFGEHLAQAEMFTVTAVHPPPMKRGYGTPVTMRHEPGVGRDEGGFLTIVEKESSEEKQ